MPITRLESTAAALGWLADRGARALTTDSRRVAPGDAFIAWPGHAVDGRRFVPQALAAGAAACLVEGEGVDAFAAWPTDAPVAALAGLKAATGAIASGFLGTPSGRLDVIGITGTNGKTSTAWWFAQAMGVLGHRCGVIGTLGVGEPPSAAAADSETSGPGEASGPDAAGATLPGAAAGPVGDARALAAAASAEAIVSTGMTTPDPVTVQAGLKRFADAGFTACAIEATSIGLAEHRLAGTQIRTALFTNFTQDHLDYHGTMEAYWHAKAQLFAWPGLQAAVLNLDDPHGADLACRLQNGPLAVWTYSTTGAARLRGASVRYAGGGLRFDVLEGSASATVSTQLIGAYNVANLLAVIGGLRTLGVSLADAAAACTHLTPVPGRMQRVAADRAGPQVVVDYAHTPDALEKALLALQPFADERGGKLWCVFGCGGNRDTAKRPRMGALAQRLSHQVIVTSDNPRNEAPAFILLQIVAGFPGHQDRVKVIEDRRAAIAHAVRNAAPNDVILIAGKGHEAHQEVRGVKHPFSDVAEASVALARRPAAAPEASA